jgi:hypothetical protein
MGISADARVSALPGNIQYRACVVMAAANWRSAVQMALSGMKK